MGSKQDRVFLSYTHDDEEAVLEAMKKLPSKQSAIFHLRHFEQMKIAEISQAMGLSQSDVKVSLHRARNLLKEELKKLRDAGLEPIPKLNFSTAHDTWLGPYSRCVSTPTYYKACEDLIEEVVELFDKPRFFHLGGPFRSGVVGLERLVGVEQQCVLHGGLPLGRW